MVVRNKIPYSYKYNDSYYLNMSDYTISNIYRTFTSLSLLSSLINSLSLRLINIKNTLALSGLALYS